MLSIKVMTPICISLMLVQIVEQNDVIVKIRPDYIKEVKEHSCDSKRDCKFYVLFTLDGEPKRDCGTSVIEREWGNRTNNQQFNDDDFLSFPTQYLRLHFLYITLCHANGGSGKVVGNNGKSFLLPTDMSVNKTHHKLYPSSGYGRDPNNPESISFQFVYAIEVTCRMTLREYMTYSKEYGDYSASMTLGETIWYDCEAHHQTSNGTYMYNLTCTLNSYVDGIKQHESLKCVPVCSIPSDLGVTVGGIQLLNGSYFTLACVPGKALAGLVPNRKKQYTACRIGTGGALWNPPVEPCLTNITCDAFAELEHGQLFHPHGSRYIYGNRVEHGYHLLIECAVGFKSDVKNTTCELNAKVGGASWSQTPFCKNPMRSTVGRHPHKEENQTMNSVKQMNIKTSDNETDDKTICAVISVLCVVALIFAIIQAVKCSKMYRIHDESPWFILYIPGNSNEAALLQPPTSPEPNRFPSTGPNSITLISPNRSKTLSVEIDAIP